jgi:hypothetical protein
MDDDVAVAENEVRKSRSNRIVIGRKVLASGTHTNFSRAQDHGHDVAPLDQTTAQNDYNVAPLPFHHDSAHVQKTTTG